MSGYTTPIAYYKDGLPYTANGQVIIIITGGPTPPTGTIPTTPPSGGGLYVTPLPSNVAPVYLKDRLKVEYIPGKGRQFTPYNQLTQLQNIFNKQISEARARISVPVNKIIESANTSVQETIKTQTDGDNRVKEKNNQLKDALKGLQDANTECQAADNDVNQKHAAAEKALNDVKPKLGLTKVAPEDFDMFLTQILQPVSRTYWENFSVKPRVAEFNAKQRLIAALDNLAVIINDVKSKTNALAEQVKQIIIEREKEDTDLKDAVKATADFYKELTEKFGEQSAKVSEELAAAAKGKTIKNADEALKAFEKYKDVLNKKFSVKDREAISNALESLKRDEMAKNFARFSKAFKYVGNTIDVYDTAMELKKAVETDNWRPFFVKLESLAAGRAATAITAFSYSIILGTPLGIFGFAIMMTLVSVFVDDKFVEKINSALKI
ncbi:colicin pore forming domain-containing protein [Enterobacter sp. BIGb0383]|uniref:colicin-like pore-forming protein n=1 Tax=unclassified Enterobacter TaxID=2608935 RepID=UPI000FA3884D|nr:MULTISPECIES: colicin-like pore-forming protein [unclassified Enterobacter]ROP59156.1 colicin pore forming domain-containing protein [Enterobacter sp. BIGb0383]ROS09378.1 colicin pore forming domain-containing protein [Enterobacter sp. BIGb0359]